MLHYRTGILVCLFSSRTLNIGYTDNAEHGAPYARPICLPSCPVSLVRCCRQSQSQSESIALQNWFALPSDLTRDWVHAITMKKENKAIVALCCGIAYLPISGRHKLLLVLNPAAWVSFLIMNKINHTAFMEGRHFPIIIFLFIRSIGCVHVTSSNSQIQN